MWAWVIPNCPIKRLLNADTFPGNTLTDATWKNHSFIQHVQREVGAFTGDPRHGLYALQTVSGQSHVKTITFRGANYLFSSTCSSSHLCCCHHHCCCCHCCCSLSFGSLTVHRCSLLSHRTVPLIRLGRPSATNRKMHVVNIIYFNSARKPKRTSKEKVFLILQKYWHLHTWVMSDITFSSRLLNILLILHRLIQWLPLNLTALPVIPLYSLVTAFSSPALPSPSVTGLFQAPMSPPKRPPVTFASYLPASPHVAFLGSRAQHLSLPRLSSFSASSLCFGPASNPSAWS